METLKLAATLKFWTRPKLLEAADARERVAKGAALLDERLPGWWNKVDTKNLDTGDLDHCVLGQLYGDYVRGILSLLGLVAPDRPSGLGFDMKTNLVQPPNMTLWRREAEALNQEWVKAIEARRAARN